MCSRPMPVSGTTSTGARLGNTPHQSHKLLSVLCPSAPICIRPPLDESRSDKKKGPKINSFGPQTAGLDGCFFLTKGWGSKGSFPHSKVCFPWVSREGTWGVPGILPGCPGSLGCLKSLCKKSSSSFFRSLMEPWMETDLRFLVNWLEAARPTLPL